MHPGSEAEAVGTGPSSLGRMIHVGAVIAGCAPGTNECADQTPYPGLESWFVVLVLVLAALLLLAFVAGAAHLVRGRARHRSEIPSAVDEPAARA